MDADTRHGTDTTTAGTGALPAAEATALLRDRLDFVVGAAARAVSIHNTQPWRFSVRDGALVVLADRARQLSAADPRGRELVISCGAAVYNAKLALRMLGYAVEVALLPVAGDPDLLARLSLGAKSSPTSAERRLFAAIPHRHTHRGAFTDVEVPRDVLIAAQDAADDEGATLHLAERPGERRALSALVVEADRAQRADAAIRAEVQAWTVPPSEHRGDGVPPHAYPVHHEGSEPAAFPVRDFNAGRGWGVEEPAEAGPDSHPVGVLTTEGDREVDWLVAGQALQHILLLSAIRWIFAALYSQPMELPDVRVLVRDEIGTADFPQMLLRFGHSPVTTTTPRRAVTDVVAGDVAGEAGEVAEGGGGAGGESG